MKILLSTDDRPDYVIREIIYGLKYNEIYREYVDRSLVECIFQYSAEMYLNSCTSIEELDQNYQKKNLC
jgi:hypothetical protein